MENDELHHRVNAIHRIKLIATIMGPDGTKNQLLPYLESNFFTKKNYLLFLENFKKKCFFFKD
jgi:serine/threonine-protein phosphatase 2A regulatory subunit A